MGLYNNGYKRLKKQIQQQYYTSHNSKNKFTEINLYNECDECDDSDECDECDEYGCNRKNYCGTKNKALYFCNNICTIS